MPSHQVAVLPGGAVNVLTLQTCCGVGTASRDHGAQASTGTPRTPKGLVLGRYMNLSKHGGHSQPARSQAQPSLLSPPLCCSPRVSATKLHGPDLGVSYSEATEAPVHGVGTADEAAALPTHGLQPPAAPRAATEGCLRREEESALAAPVVQVSHGSAVVQGCGWGWAILVDPRPLHFPARGFPLAGRYPPACSTRPSCLHQAAAGARYCQPCGADCRQGDAVQGVAKPGAQRGQLIQAGQPGASPAAPAA